MDLCTLICTRGDFGHFTEWVSVYGEEEFLGIHQGGSDCEDTFTEDIYEVDGYKFNEWLANGGLNFNIATSDRVDSGRRGCRNNDVYIELDVVPLQYGYCGDAIIETGTMSSVQQIPIGPGFSLNPDPIDFCFNNLPFARPGTDVTIKVSTKGDFDADYEYISVLDDSGMMLGKHQGGGNCEENFTPDMYTVPAVQYNQWVMTGAVTFRLTPSSFVDENTCTNEAYVHVVIPNSGTGMGDPHFQVSGRIDRAFLYRNMLHLTWFSLFGTTDMDRQLV